MGGGGRFSRLAERLGLDPLVQCAVRLLGELVGSVVNQGEGRVTEECDCGAQKVRQKGVGTPRA